MAIIKKILALGLIGGSVIFAALIVAKNNSIEITPSSKISADLNRRFENLPPITAPVKNLTLEAVENLGEQIRPNSLNNPGQLENPEEIVARFLAESAKDFDYNSLKLAVDRSRLISADSSQKSVDAYIRSFNSLLGSSFGALSLTDDDPGKNLAILKSAYEKVIEEMYRLPVPAVFLALHEKTISVLGGQKSAAEIIQNYQKDPLRALLSLGAITKLNEELSAIQKTISIIGDINS